MSLPGLVPVPAAVELLDAAPLGLGDGVAIEGPGDAVAALARLIAARTGLGAVDGGVRIVLTVEDDAEGAGAAESYRLTVDETAVTVTGADAAGLFYGIQTLGQLIDHRDDRWTVPAVRIEDAPRFAYRGAMLDVARHFHDVATVKTYIEHLAGLKLNVLHLHLSDDQGWRLQLHSRPRLTERASATAVAGHPGGFYTQDDYREILAHAAAHHMLVVPELDVPGHTHAVSLAYPELAEDPLISDHIRELAALSGGGLPVKEKPYTGVAVGFSALRIREEATYAFLADALGELAALTPGPYLHVGGDETLRTSAEDFAYFMQRVTAIVAGLGKTPITWHEAGVVPGLAAGTVGQYWGFVRPEDDTAERARAYVRAGGKLVLSPADAMYLDMRYAAGTRLGLEWAHGVTTIERAYAWEPTTVVEAVTESDILGIEAPLWSETLVDLADIEEMAFPRAAAAAELGWSPAPDQCTMRTWASFRERVGDLGPLWRSLGIGFAPVSQIPWRTQ